MAKKMISTPIMRKEYNYELRMVGLKFVLRQDNTQEMLMFKELLEKALSDVDDDIKNFRKK